ncbi:hypothetical protein BKA93DRAFT_19223 [Sparassis latifolia]
MENSTEFSSNRHSVALQEFEVPIRHPEFCFEDANIAVVAGHQYFLVHQGLLCHHSPVFRHVVRSLAMDKGRRIEGRPALPVQDPPEEMAQLLRALYTFSFRMFASDFLVVSALLRMSTKYAIEDLRKEVLRTLLMSWPTTLPLWELREKAVTNADGMYAPRPNLPHPILMIELAREVNAPELLPSAFYDLSRYLPSQLATGYTHGSATHLLAADDLLRVLNGKELSARFFSTFIVNELEGRLPSEWCLHRHQGDGHRARACQMAFEAITFEVLRDVNGVVCNRNSDPLFAIVDSFLMQTRDDEPGVENRAVCRACEACRMEYAVAVEATREEFWRRIPEWFDLQVKNWG